MKCPKCGSDQFKLATVKKQRIKELPQFLPVSATCANCGKNIKAYIIHEDLNTLIQNQQEMAIRICEIVAILRQITDIILKEKLKQKRTWWQ